MTTAAAIGAPAARTREAVIASVIGNTLEWYDFAVYGYFVSTISRLFFPSSDPLASTLATYAVFGVGFVMRPVGSVVFGIYGDRQTVVDDGVSKRLTLNQGPNIIRAAIVNGGGATDFCARFLDAGDKPLKGYTVSVAVR